jgi:pimeloyl-ACP methyl ester carboxylesterase
MTTLVFLHGSWHAAWNWHKVTPLLDQRGHGSAAIDLPGHGRDRTPARRVTLAACVDRVLDAIDRTTGDVVLQQNPIPGRRADRPFASGRVRVL